MAGHSKWAQIKRKKAVVDAKRGQTFTKIIKEITVSARLGGGDEDSNPRLRQAILVAKGANMPSENIKRAIQKGTGGLLGGVSYEDSVLEGYGPGGVAIMIEVTTDNRKRTLSEIRHLITRYGGKLGETGCVAWMFERKVLITVDKESQSEEALLESIMSGGGDDFIEEDDVYIIQSGIEEMISVLETLKRNGFTVRSSQVLHVATNSVNVKGEVAKKITQLMEALDEHEDVQKLSANFYIEDHNMEPAI